MKPIYHHYETWEDYQHGMYNEDKEDRKKRVKKAIRLLKNEWLCYRYMKRVTVEWKNACEQAFTNKLNHRSFLGQCACCLYAGIHEDETREAWGLLSNETRRSANAIADKVYKEWLKQNDFDYVGHQHNIFEYLPERKEK